MTDRRDSGAASGPAQAREERLARALRENLRRRKAQARAAALDLAAADPAPAPPRAPPQRDDA